MFLFDEIYKVISVTLVTVTLASTWHPSAAAIGVNINFNFTLFGIENITQIIGLNTPPVDPGIAEDAKSTTLQIIMKYGYEAEAHYVTTEDGYVLELHRISGSPKYLQKKKKKVVFLQHGILDSSATWVLTGPEKGLGFILADQGFDVWLGNSRGNVYSTKHIHYSPYSFWPSKRKEYWSFSFHEIGIYDLPACVDYVLLKSGQKRLQYIAHSQGTTAFFILVSQKPEYNDKFEMIHAMAPIAYMSHVTSPTIRALLPFMNGLKKICWSIGMNFIPPTTSILALKGFSATQLITKHVFLSLAGYKTNQLNTTLLPVIFSHVPAGSSLDQPLHYGQLIKSGYFRQFDHGFFGNLYRYRSTSPPEYDLKKVTAPIALYYSPNDWLASIEDVQRLKNELPNVVKDFVVIKKEFNHMDFVWGIDAPEILYDEIMKTIEATDEVNNMLDAPHISLADS